MTSFVLVHGAWHGGWCWREVVPRLEAAGHRVVAPDLPGHGDDPTPASKVDLADYVRRIVAAIDSLPGEVVLVGHSLGGLTISQAGEERADRIGGLVYLAAFMLGDGQGFGDVSGSPQLTAAVGRTEDGSGLTVDPARVRDVFYADCSEADVKFACERLCPQPIGLVRTPLRLSADRFGRLDRDFILCARDRAVLPEQQREFIASQPCRAVHEMDCSHSPFFSRPDELVGILASIAGS